MNTPNYTIDVDNDRKLVRLTLAGMWDGAILDRYIDDVAKLTTSDYRFLVDLREHGVQSREITDKIQGRLMQGAWRDARRAVLVSASSLHRMQVQRLATSEHTSFFENEDEAMQWLLADDTASSVG